jgi:hypothetical protein
LPRVGLDRVDSEIPIRASSRPPVHRSPKVVTLRPSCRAGAEPCEPVDSTKRPGARAPRYADNQLINEISIDYLDQCAVNYRDHSQLEWLNLDGTQVSDAGLVHLKRLTKLSQLNLFNTRVTDAGVNELKQALPSPHINH